MDAQPVEPAGRRLVFALELELMLERELLRDLEPLRKRELLLETAATSATDSDSVAFRSGYRIGIGRVVQEIIAKLDVVA